MKKFTKVIAITLFVCALGFTSCTEQALNDDDQPQAVEKEKVKPNTGG